MSKTAKSRLGSSAAGPGRERTEPNLRLAAWADDWADDRANDESEIIGLWTGRAERPEPCCRETCGDRCYQFSSLLNSLLQADAPKPGRTCLPSPFALPVQNSRTQMAENQNENPGLCPLPNLGQRFPTGRGIHSDLFSRVFAGHPRAVRTFLATMKVPDDKADRRPSDSGAAAGSSLAGASPRRQGSQARMEPSEGIGPASQTQFGTG